jgi:2-keto-myo-inositol isomerase
MSTLNRRDFLLAGSAAGVATGCATTQVHSHAEPAKKKYQNGKSQWPLCMNTSTIRPATVEEKIRVTAEAGYDAIELWMNDLENYEKEGKSVKDLGKMAKDKGLFVIDVIGLWDGIPETQAEYDKALVISRNRMRLASEVGSRHVAVLPLPNRDNFDLKWATEKYREMLHIGREEYGILPAFEYVSLFKTVPRFGLAAAVAIDANDADAKLVMDLFHMYKSGSGFNGVNHITGEFIATFHWNDAPGEPAPEEMRDKHRVMPGEGIFPLVDVLKQLKKIDYTGPLSLELFNEALWAMPAIDVAKMGVEKMMVHVEQAG